jgi:hypothetical protein
MLLFMINNKFNSRVLVQNKTPNLNTKPLFMYNNKFNSRVHVQDKKYAKCRKHANYAKMQNNLRFNSHVLLCVCV